MQFAPNQTETLSLNMLYSVNLLLSNTCLPTVSQNKASVGVPWVFLCLKLQVCEWRPHRTWMCACIYVHACLHSNFHYLSLSWNSICSSLEWNCIDCWLRCQERGGGTTRKDWGAVGREKERVTNRRKVLACAVAASCRSIGEFKSEKMKGKKQRARDGRDEPLMATF